MELPTNTAYKIVCDVTYTMWRFPCKYLKLNNQLGARMRRHSFMTSEIKLIFPEDNPSFGVRRSESSSVDFTA